MIPLAVISTVLVVYAQRLSGNVKVVSRDESSNMGGQVSFCKPLGDGLPRQNCRVDKGKRDYLEPQSQHLSIYWFHGQVSGVLSRCLVLFSLEQSSLPFAAQCARRARGEETQEPKIPERQVLDGLFFREQDARTRKAA